MQHHATIRVDDLLAIAVAIGTAITSAPCAAAAMPCTPGWERAIGQPGMNDTVSALIIFDDGSGPALIAGGSFTTADGEPAARVARWDGRQWTPLGDLDMFQVLDLAVYDHGAGPMLYAAGGGLSRWDGETWTPVPGSPGSWLGALHVHDAGEGPELYVSGGFTLNAVDGVAEYVARYDGTNWKTVGEGLDSVVHDFEIFDAGDGAALYGAGAFVISDDSGGFPAVGFAKFDGTAWAGAGGGLNTTPYTITQHDDGSGPALFLGGDFTVVGGFSVPLGGIPVNHIAKWDGQQWSALGEGLDGDVLALAGLDEDGDGPAPPVLFAGGDFTTAGGQPAVGIARWDGKAWSAVGEGVDGAVHALAIAPDAASISVGGEFTTAGDKTAGHISAWGCTTPPTPGDLDDDGEVGVGDLLILLGAWGDCNGCAEDLNGDDTVGVGDLLMLLDAWG